MANKVNSILDQRMKKPSNTSKMAAMAKQSVNGQLTSFSGVFSVTDLSSSEKKILEDILHNYAIEEEGIDEDLETLISLTSEVKAINNQAALLHGERIKKAHQILIKYRDGAFTSWLIATYGNRQTPYNLMQYYEFFEAMPKELRPKMEHMPRQAIYVLASRTGSLKQKQALIENYKGETKTEMLAIIRQLFPLDQKDKRKQKIGTVLLLTLERIYQQLKKASSSISNGEKQQIQTLLQKIQHQLGK